MIRTFPSVDTRPFPPVDWRRTPLRSHRDLDCVRDCCPFATGRSATGPDSFAPAIYADAGADSPAQWIVTTAQRSLNSTPPLALLSRELSMISTSTASAVTSKFFTTASVMSLINARFCCLVRPSMAWI